MRKRLYILMIAIMAMGLVACGKESETKDDITEVQAEEIPVEEVEEKSVEEMLVEETVGFVNPWTASDKAGVLEVTGFDMDAPAGATDINYSYMAENRMAQLTYTYEGNDWVYRIQPTGGLIDISGMYYEYDLRMPGTVAGNEAEFLAWTDSDIDSEYIDDLYGIQIVNWYDNAVGVTYSLSAAGYNINGMDIQVYAEQLYLPDQGNIVESTNIVNSESDLATFTVGFYDSEIDSSGFTIEDNGDGTYKVELTVIRLCYLENGVGTVYETIDGDEMTVSAIDPNGNDIRYVIYQLDDGTYEAKFVDSTWEYLPHGTVYTGYVKK